MSMRLWVVMPTWSARDVTDHYPDLADRVAYPVAMAGTTLTELRTKRTEIIEIARARGASRVRVFGSVARGEATGGSDVDFLVDLEPDRSLFDLGGLLMDLQDLLQRNVDVVTERGLRPRVAQRVLADAIDL